MLANNRGLHFLEHLEIKPEQVCIAQRQGLPTGLTDVKQEIEERDGQAERELRRCFLCLFYIRVSVHHYICAWGNLPLAQRSAICIF